MGRSGDVVRGLGQSGSRPDAQAGRRRDPRQPAGAQKRSCAWCDRGKGVRLLFLPPHSPDFDPIENALAKPKALLRKASARTVDDLSRAISATIDTFTPA